MVAGFDKTIVTELQYLTVLSKKESTDICFQQQISMPMSTFILSSLVFDVIGRFNTAEK